MRLHDYLDYWALRRPDGEFAVQGHRSVTYGEAAAAANQMANALVAAGLGAGERIAVLAKNSIEYAVLYYAAAKAGVVPVPLNYRSSPPEWASILNDAQTRVLIAGAPFKADVDAIRDRLTTVDCYFGLNGETAPHRRCAPSGAQLQELRPETGAGWDSLLARAAEQPARAPGREVREDDDLYQVFTSGTTGRAKGAILTHRAVTANIAQIAHSPHRGPPGERSLVVAPLCHAAASVWTSFAPVSWGATLVIVADFDPVELVRTLSEDRIGYAILVPSVLQACLVAVPDIAQRSYPALRLIHTGSAPVAEATLRRAVEAFRCDFIHAYGMTETTAGLTILTPDDIRRALAARPELLASAGRPLVGTDVRIVDEYDRPVPTGAVGEIVARGPQLMRGYWDLPDVSAQATRGGWLHTGDVGRLDGDGYLYICDRVKDMIVSGGVNVYPRMVEAVLFDHPAVAEAAVIGVPDDRWGETVKAVVVLRPGMHATAAELIALCRSRLGGFECPRSVDFVGALPRTTLGKVRKRELREPYWAGQARRVAGA